MSAAGIVVVDTNILFSALLQSRSRFTSILFSSDHEFFVCELVIVELFRHKERMLRAARVPEAELVEGLHALLRRVNIYKEDLISGDAKREAATLCRDVDPTDTPHVALTLMLGARLWTGDRRLRTGLEARGFHRFFDP